MDETEKQIYLKYSLSKESNELTRINFDWIPRLDTWEHLCFVKKPEKEKELNQIKFFVNGENKGQGECRMIKLSISRQSVNFGNRP